MPVDRDPPARPPEAWPRVHRAARRLVTPLQQFLAIEAASGVVLIVATVIALAWANSPWVGSYHDLWHLPLGVSFHELRFERSLHFWVNEGLMTVFFLVVGIEIRRELHAGSLATWRQSALPLAAAVGGMLIPAGIYLLFNHGKAGAGGWGVPMATDIAFAVGVLTLLGNRVSPGMRVLLLALAVIDDIGAIIVIAAFYTGGIDPWGLAIAGAGMAAVLILRAAGVRSPLAYTLAGVVVWAGLYTTGIHPTLAGVFLGLMTPVVAWEDEISIAEHLQHKLHGVVAFGIMPLFALANAGVELGGADLSGDGLWVFVGCALGLALGKPLGIVAASVGATATGVATRGDDVARLGVLVVGIVGGIGFTMSLFVAQLAFPPGPLLETAKLAVIAGSTTSILAGLVVGRVALRARGAGAAQAA